MISIVLAQINLCVGDISKNCQKILSAIQQSIDDHHADIVIFPELSLTGYPPEDLLLREDFLQEAQETLVFLQHALPNDIIAIIGYPEYQDQKRYNSAAILTKNKILGHYRKQVLPNYGVFDEKRYFEPGSQPSVFSYKKVKFGLVICEDLWQPEAAQQTKAAGADCLIAINASPFNHQKLIARKKTMRMRITETSLPLLYVNACYGYDDLIFDGSSFILNAQGALVGQAPFAQETLLPALFDPEHMRLSSKLVVPEPSPEAQTYQALVMGVRDYARKNGFQRALLGFSGGIDSSLTLAIAVDALGRENVLPVLLPSRYTSQLSISASKAQLASQQLNEKIISIEPAFHALLSSLHIDPENPPNDLTTQNLQARCRGIILMALSNTHHALLLNTSNKSELAVGYGTLYGDMCGGYAVLKDVWKTEVYRLSRYRNQLSPVIPQEIIDRPPSAELGPGQLDTDALPPYEVLDEILKRYIETLENPADIIKAGFSREMVNKVIGMVNRNEYKRRQAAPGPRVTTCAFGRERRFPITTPYPF